MDLIGEGEYGKVYKFTKDRVIKLSTCLEDDCNCPSIDVEIKLAKIVNDPFLNITPHCLSCPKSYMMNYIPYDLTNVLIVKHLVGRDACESYYFRLMMDKFDLSESESRLSKIQHLFCKYKIEQNGGELEFDEINYYLTGNKEVKWKEVLLTASEYNDIVIQLLNQLIFLQEHKIIHRDIKGSNIRIIGLTAQICDFGTALHFDEDGKVIAGNVDYFHNLSDSYNTWFDPICLIYDLHLRFDDLHSFELLKKYYQRECITLELIDKPPVQEINAKQY